MSLNDSGSARHAELNLDSQKLVITFSSRIHGNMSLAYGDTTHALDNRKNFLNNLDIDYRDLICAQQVHTSNIKYVKEDDRGKGALSSNSAIKATDAFITDKKNVPVAVFTADCLSVFLYDPLTPAIGLVHAGWRSSKENITDKTIKLMHKQFNTKPCELRVILGPSMRSCCFEVSGDFSKIFPKDVSRRGNSYYLDLVAANKREILEKGVKEANITDSGICTFCRNDQFFSFRKEGESCGRIMSVMMLR